MSGFRLSNSMAQSPVGTWAMISGETVKSSNHLPPNGLSIGIIWSLE